VLVKLVNDEVNKSNLGDRIIYSSFDWRVLKEIKNLNPKIAKAYLTYQQETGVKIKGTIYDMSPWMDFMPLHDSDNIELPRLIKALGGDAWHPYHGDVKEEIVKKSHEEGLPVNVWTVNEEFDMMRMIDYGVDGIMTDYPLRLKEYCEKKNIKWF
jgi:glycerophosphoryl diester phosphodiesterase